MKKNRLFKVILALSLYHLGYPIAFGTRSLRVPLVAPGSQLKQLQFTLNNPSTYDQTLTVTVRAVGTEVFVAKETNAGQSAAFNSSCSQTFPNSATYPYSPTPNLKSCTTDSMTISQGTGASFMLLLIPNYSGVAGSGPTNGAWIEIDVTTSQGYLIGFGKQMSNGGGDAIDIPINGGKPF